jgi:hypothetical protein
MLPQVPSCSRCTAKGLTCEPRSTRRTSDSNYRSAKKHVVSPKRFPATSSINTVSRHSSPRSIPSANRHQLVRAVSQMDFHTAVKLGQQRPDFAAMSMLQPLQTYTPQIIDECYSYSSSPEPNSAAFSHNMDKTNVFHSGRLTPQTPESFSYTEAMPITDPFDQYMNLQPWSHDGQMPIGLGFEHDIPGLMPTEPDMRVWAPNFHANPAPTTNMNNYSSAVCESPASAGVWTNPTHSVSPSQPPHTRAVPSLSISECSAQESDSPSGAQDDWSCFNGVPTSISSAKPISSTPYLDSIKTFPMGPRIWEDDVLSRMYAHRGLRFYG